MYFVEATHLINLDKLVGDYPPNYLHPRGYNTSILMRFPDNFIFALVLSGIIGLVVNYIRFNSSPTYSLFAIPVIIFLGNRKFRVKNAYFIDSDGLLIPHLWFTRTLIKMEEIVRISMEEDQIEVNGIQETIHSIVLILDTSKLKFNFTGLEDSRLVISELFHDKTAMESFYSELLTYHRNAGLTSNTQAERLSKQVNNAWNNRWKLIFFRVLDSSSEFGYYLFLLYLTMLIFTYSHGIILFFQIVFLVYVFVILGFQIVDRPNSIIGFRPHELGPIFYNEADLATTIRFIMISQPIGINLMNCELFFEDDPLPQNYKLDQLHPKETEPGKLSYGVGQFIGNHSKAVGASIAFSFIGQKKEYSISIYWGIL